MKFKKNNNNNNKAKVLGQPYPPLAAATKVDSHRQGEGTTTTPLTQQQHNSSSNYMQQQSGADSSISSSATSSISSGATSSGSSRATSSGSSVQPRQSCSFVLPTWTALRGSGLISEIYFKFFFKLNTNHPWHVTRPRCKFRCLQTSQQQCPIFPKKIIVSIYNFKVSSISFFTSQVKTEVPNFQHQFL